MLIISKFSIMSGRDYKQELDIYNSKMGIRDELVKKWGIMCKIEQFIGYIEELKSKIRSAEVASLEVVSVINEHLKEASSKLYDTDAMIDLRLENNSSEGNDAVECIIENNGMRREIHTGVSHGECERFVLSFCIALNQMFGPDLMLLDEPLVGLDEKSAIRTILYLKEISERRGGVPRRILLPEQIIRRLLRHLIL